MDGNLPGSVVHGIFHARILEWVAIHLLHGIFLTQGLNLGLLHCRRTLYCLNYQPNSTAVCVMLCYLYLLVLQDYCFLHYQMCD